MDDFGFYRYEDVYIVGFRGERIWYLERQWGSGNAAVTLEEARLEMGTLIPTDSRLVETYTPAEDRLGDLHHSDSLAERFSEDSWIGGDPGDFLVLYRIYEGEVHSAVVALGNNP